METEDTWEESNDAVRQVLRDLPNTDPTIEGGRLARWYAVAEYQFDDHSSLVRLHGTGPEQQAAWHSMGLLQFALRAEEDGAFGYDEPDE